MVAERSSEREEKMTTGMKEPSRRSPEESLVAAKEAVTAGSKTTST